MIRAPLPANTSSNTAVNLLSRSRIRESEPVGACTKIHEQVAGLLGGPGAGGVRGDAQDVHAPGLDLHHEQDVQALEEHGVNVQEVARQDPGRLGGQELPPGRGCPAWGGREPGRGQDPADRSRADATPQAEQFTLDATAPPRVLPGQPPNQLTDLLRGRWAPGGVRVGPLVLDQAPVPGEQGPRRSGSFTRPLHHKRY